MAATCYAHPDEPAKSACRRCFRSICGACTIVDGMQPHCPDCMHTKRRAPWVRRGVTLGLLLALGGGGYFAYETYKPPYDYGQYAGKIRELEQQLKTEPCDKEKTLKLLEYVRGAGDSRGTITRAKDFWTRCGELNRLKWVTYQAHQNLGEWDLAIADVGSLVDDDPYDASKRAWRARVYADKGDFAHAAEDFQQSMLLYPRFTDVPVELATALEKLGKPCEAASALEELLQYYPDKPWSAGLRARADKLQKDGDCAGGNGEVHLRIDARRSGFYAKARLNDKEVGSFLVDTGASFVTISRAFADKLGLGAANGRPVVLSTANGKKTGTLISVDKVAVEDLQATHVSVVVVDDIGPDLDGLLGMTFLARFDVHQGGGKLDITRR